MHIINNTPQQTDSAEDSICIHGIHRLGVGGAVLLTSSCFHSRPLRPRPVCSLALSRLSYRPLLCQLFGLIVPFPHTYFGVRYIHIAYPFLGPPLSLAKLPTRFRSLWFLATSSQSLAQKGRGQGRRVGPETYSQPDLPPPLLLSYNLANNQSSALSVLD